MKKTAMILAAATLLAVPPASFAVEHDHGAMTMDHGGGMMEKGKAAQEEVVDGVKATFKVMDMRGVDRPKGMKETHHLMLSFRDAASGKLITDGEVKLKVQGPDKAEQTKELMGMQGHFGADFDLSKQGKYGVMVKFKLKDGKVRSAKFWYEVK